MERTALLIIDMQLGALLMENPPFFQIGELTARIKKLIDKARQHHVPIIYAQHHHPNGFPAYGSNEWKIIPEIEPRAEDLVIHKSTADVFLNTSLHVALQSRGISSLVICGIQTAECVDTACRRAFSLGYKVTLVKNGHTTFDSPILKASQAIDHHNSLIGTWFGKLSEAEEILF